MTGLAVFRRPMGRRHGADILVPELWGCRPCFAGRDWSGRMQALWLSRPCADPSRLQLQACPLCMTTDLYIQKDFPQGLGLFIVVVGFAISTVFWYYEMPIPAYLVLVASGLLTC